MLKSSLIPDVAVNKNVVIWVNMDNVYTETDISVIKIVADW